MNHSGSLQNLRKISKVFLPQKQVSENNHSRKNEGSIYTEKQTPFGFATDLHGLIRTSNTRKTAHFSEIAQPFSTTTDLFVKILSLFTLK